MKLVLIPPGDFMMGSPQELIEEELKACFDHAGPDWYRYHLLSEKPQHRMRITKPFHLGVTEVTQEEYQRVVGTSPSAFSATGIGKAKVVGQDTKRFPVENVTWDQAVEFCRKLSEVPEEKAAGRRYRLPSEAEWEYACRAGSTGRFNSSSSGSGISKDSEQRELSDYGWFKHNAAGMTHAVALKRANAWDLYDMHGNVWEWCQDLFGKQDYGASSADNPTGLLGGSHRIYRGGSWLNPTRYGRSAFRGVNDGGPRFRFGDLGFRVSLVLVDKPGEQPTPPGTTTQPSKEAGSFTAAPPSNHDGQAVTGTQPSPLIGPNEKWKLPPGAPSPAIAPFDPKKAQEYQDAWARYLGVPVEMTNSIGMKLVLIPPGEFDMGDEMGTRREKPVHKVMITKAFYLAKCEVMQEEWEAVMGKGNNPSQFKGPKNPVETVSWDGCQVFLSKLNGKCRVAEGGYRLPTEAQWEYACRAGSKGCYCFSDSKQEVDDYGWHEKNSENKTHPVGEKQPNAWGLYDMHGNVWEWCADWVSDDYYRTSPRTDPMGPASGTWRVLRGQGWSCGPINASSRNAQLPVCRTRDLGFRVSLVLVDKPGEQPTPPGATTPPSKEAGSSSAAPPANHDGQAVTGTQPSPLIGPDGKWRLPRGAPSPAIAPFDAKKAKEHQEAWAKQLGVPCEITNSIGMKLVLIPPGEFDMGSTPEEIAAELELVRTLKGLSQN